MEITKIDKTSQTAINQEVKLQRLKRKVCIYYPEVICQAPRLIFKICQRCVRCAQYVKGNAARTIFDYIKSFAISLLNKMDIGTVVEPPD